MKLYSCIYYLNYWIFSDYLASCYTHAVCAALSIYQRVFRVESVPLILLKVGISISHRINLKDIVITDWLDVNGLA